MNRPDMWTGRYRNIFYEIVKWNNCSNTIWNYYIYLDEKNVCEELNNAIKKLEIVLGGRCYRYDTLNEYIEMHGGVTYFSIHLHPRKVYCFGCDYAHLWDNGCLYDENRIFSDVKETINRLYDTKIILKKEEAQ